MTRPFRADRHIACALTLIAGLAIGCGDSHGTKPKADAAIAEGGVGEGDGATGITDASLNPFKDGGMLSCPAGKGDCDKDAENGCEADLTELANCGTCGNACEAGANANVACNNSQCVLTSCKPAFADCDGMDENGCETDLNAKATCGSCDNNCGLGDCMSGSCTVPGCDTANTLKNDCDGDPKNGCEKDVNTLTDCGNCNVPCDAAHGTESCSTGVCLVDVCDADYDDCNTLDSDGCEQPLNTNLHCGDCNTPCAFTNAAADCSTGTCMPGACADDFKDCNLDMPLDGCERLLTTLSDCGDCNVPCDVVHASESCSTGDCTFTACDTDWVDVNQDATMAVTDGCECNDVKDHPTCSMAMNLGTLSAGQTVNRNDVIAVQGDEDWYTFSIANAASRAGRGLTVSLVTNPGAAYKFDVVNGCVNGVNGPYTCKVGGQSAGITTYFFGDACSGGAGGCYNQAGPTGGATGVAFGTAAPTVFMVKVFRPAGAALSCAGYTLRIQRT